MKPTATGPRRTARSYADYRQSGQDWQRLIPAHWTSHRLKRTVISCQNGIWGEEPNGQDDLPCIRVADFNRIGLRLNGAAPTIRSITPEQRVGRILQRGDLLLEKSGGGQQQPVGAVIQYDRDEAAVCSNFVARMPVASGYNSRFLAYLHAMLYSGRINLRSIKQTTGIQNLDSQQYLDERVAVPPEPEQRGIAAFLDRETARIDELIAKKARLIELLEEKRTALVARMVTKGLDSGVPMKPSGVEWMGRVPGHWQVRRIKTFRPFVTSGSRGWAEFYSDPGPGFIRISNISDPGIELNLDDLRRVCPPPGSEGDRTRVREKDVLVSITANIGAVGVVRGPIEECYVSQHIALIRFPSTAELAEWVGYCLEAPVGRAQFELLVTGGTKQGLGLEDVRNLVVPVPPPQERVQLVRRLDSLNSSVRRLEGSVREAVSRLREYRAALIMSAVTGQIDVRRELA